METMDKGIALHFAHVRIVKECLGILATSAGRTMGGSNGHGCLATAADTSDAAIL